MWAIVVCNYMWWNSCMNNLHITCVHFCCWQSSILDKKKIYSFKCHGFIMNKQTCAIGNILCLSSASVVMVNSHCSRRFTSPNTQENVKTDYNAGLSWHFHLSLSYFNGKAITWKARILRLIPSQTDKTLNWYQWELQLSNYYH